MSLNTVQPIAWVKQAGQALTESLIVILVLGALLVITPMIGRYQDLSLQAKHASHFMAFALTRKSNLDLRSDLDTYFFANADLRWRNRIGTGLPIALETQITELRQGDDQVQLGGRDSHLRALRQDLKLQDPVLRAQVRLQVGGAGGQSQAQQGLKLADWEQRQVVLTKHTAILTGAGHGQNDTEMQNRIAQAPSAWLNAAQGSMTAGRSLSLRLQPLESGWFRPAPEFDWLQPWSGLIPRR